MSSSICSATFEGCSLQRRAASLVSRRALSLSGVTKMARSSALSSLRRSQATMPVRLRLKWTWQRLSTSALQVPYGRLDPLMVIAGYHLHARKASALEAVKQILVGEICSWCR